MTELETREWIEARRALSWRVQSPWQLGAMVALIVGIGCLLAGFPGAHHRSSEWGYFAAAACAIATALTLTGARRYRKALEAATPAR